MDLATTRMEGVGAGVGVVHISSLFFSNVSSSLHVFSSIPGHLLQTGVEERG